MLGFNEGYKKSFQCDYKVIIINPYSARRESSFRSSCTTYLTTLASMWICHIIKELSEPLICRFPHDGNFLFR